MRTLLQLVGQGSDHQITTEAVRCDAICASQAADPVSTDWAIRQFRHRHVLRPAFLAGCSAPRHDGEQATARQSAGEPRDRGLAVSYACRLGDAVDAAAFLFGRSEGEPELLLQGSEKTPRTVWRCQPVAPTTSSTVAPSGRRSIAITAFCFDGRFPSEDGSGSGKASIADQSWSISASRSPTFRRFSTPGRAFHNANSRLPLSRAACNSSFDATAVSPSLTAAGASRHSVIPSLPMM